MNNEVEKTVDSSEEPGQGDSPLMANPAETQPGDEPTPGTPSDAAAEDAQESPGQDPGMQSPDAQTASSDDTVMDEADLADLEAAEAAMPDDEPEVEVAPRGPIELNEPETEEIELNWYILKVQSNRERSISEALRRKIAIEGIDHLFGQVLVPTEKVTEFKGGKKKVVERKLWPGYIAVEMHVNDDTWFAIRETSGIGDFTGSAGKPTPMSPEEIAKILHTEDESETDEAPKLDIKFSPGDKVKVMEGNFENFEGEVSAIDETHGRVTVMLSIFGRPTPVELEYWQVESV